MSKHIKSLIINYISIEFYFPELIYSTIRCRAIYNKNILNEIVLIK